MKKFNELVQDKDFLPKSGVDIAKFNAAAKKVLANDKDLMVGIAEVEKLAAKPAPAADSAEAKARTQLVNRMVLESLYAGAIANATPVKMNGVVYRSDDQGKTWKRMTEYKLATPAAPTIPQAEAEELDAAAQARESESAEALEALGVPQARPAPSRRRPSPPRGPSPRHRAPSPRPRQPPRHRRRSRRAGARGGQPQAGSAQVNQTEGGYYGRIIVDPNDDKVVYCGDTNTTVSKDSGKTFTATGWDRGGNGKTHVDHRVVWVDPMNSKHILSGNDGGSSETWDGGDHWKQSSTINAQQFYDVFVDNEQPYNIMGGTQDNGAWLGPSQNRNQYGMFSADWTYLPTGDAFYVVRDWWNPEYVYYESQFGGSSRMNLKTGQTISLSPVAPAGETPLRKQWNNPIVLSPHNPGVVYHGSQYVWRSMSRGEPGSWVRISPDLRRRTRRS